MPVTADLPSTLSRNLAALSRHDPALAEHVRAAPAIEASVLQPSHAGPPTARLPDADGRLVQLASRVDPEREARRLIDAHLVEGPVVYVVAGLGLGYHVADLLARRGAEDAVVVAESNSALIRSALERFDWAEGLQRGYLRLVAATSRAALTRQLYPLTAVILMGTRLIVHPASARLAPGFYAAFRQAFTDFVAAARVNLTTIATNTAITVLNLLMNLGAYVAGRSIDHLKDAFAGYPAIIISAGPSLARNIHLLPEARDRAVLISIATTLKMLLDRGIEPHFVTCLDYHEITKRFFEDLPAGAAAPATHLVAEPKTTWHVFDAWRGPASVLGNEFLDACLRDVKPPIRHDRLQAGSTVAHLAFYLARYLGADPIILVGQDLGFSNGLYYMPGTVVHDTWRPELNRFWTLETKEWERIIRRRGMLRTIEDIDGRPMYTDDQMFTYLQRFEQDFQETTARVIDATEGGARKAGTDAMPLAEALARYADRPLPRDAVERLAAVHPLQPPRLRDARRALRRRVAETDAIRGICTRSIDLLNELNEHLEDPKRTKPMFASLDALREAIDSRPDAYRLVRGFAQADQLRRFQADRRIAAEGLDGLDKQRRQLARDIEYVSALAGDCDRFVAMLNRAIDRLEV